MYSPASEKVAVTAETYDRDLREPTQLANHLPRVWFRGAGKFESRAIASRDLAKYMGRHARVRRYLRRQKQKLYPRRTRKVPATSVNTLVSAVKTTRATALLGATLPAKTQELLAKTKLLVRLQAVQLNRMTRVLLRGLPLRKPRTYYRTAGVEQRPLVVARRTNSKKREAGL